MLGRIHNLYEKFDVDDSGLVDFEELNSGLRQFKMKEMSLGDFELITEHGKYLDAQDSMGKSSFAKMMHNQMNLFARRKLAMALGSASDRTSYDVLFAIKMMLATIDSLSESQKSHAGGQQAVNAPESKNRSLLLAFKGPLLKAFRLWKALTFDETDATAHHDPAADGLVQMATSSSLRMSPSFGAAWSQGHPDSAGLGMASSPAWGAPGSPHQMDLQTLAVKIDSIDKRLDCVLNRDHTEDIQSLKSMVRDLLQTAQGGWGEGGAAGEPTEDLRRLVVQQVCIASTCSTMLSFVALAEGTSRRACMLVRMQI